MVEDVYSQNSTFSSEAMMIPLPVLFREGCFDLLIFGVGIFVSGFFNTLFKFRLGLSK